MLDSLALVTSGFCKAVTKPSIPPPSLTKKIFASFLALGNLGNVLTQTGRYAQAEWSFRKALEFRPNMADVHYNL